jgi:hypothetical protein
MSELHAFKPFNGPQNLVVDCQKMYTFFFE